MALHLESSSAPLILDSYHVDSYTPHNVHTCVTSEDNQNNGKVDKYHLAKELQFELEKVVLKT